MDRYLVSYASVKMKMSESEVCHLAFTGDFGQLKVKIENKPGLASTPDTSGREPIHWAASGGHRDIVEFLLDQYSVNYDTRDESNWTPLMIAVSAGREQITRDLIGRGAQVNAVNVTGQCSLHYAASKDRYELAELLLEHGATVNIADSLGHTPLHRAATKGHAKLTKLLLSYNADHGYADSEGNSPLHYACEDEQYEAAKLLVENEASLTLRNKDEKTPLDLAPPSLKRQLQRLTERIPT